MTLPEPIWKLPSGDPESDAASMTVTGQAPGYGILGLF